MTTRNDPDTSHEPSADTAVSDSGGLVTPSMLRGVAKRLRSAATAVEELTVERDQMMAAALDQAQLTLPDIGSAVGMHPKAVSRAAKPWRGRVDQVKQAAGLAGVAARWDGHVPSGQVVELHLDGGGKATCPAGCGSDKWLSDGGGGFRCFGCAEPLPLSDPDEEPRDA